MPDPSILCVTVGRGRHRHLTAEYKHLAEQGCKLVELRLDFLVLRGLDHLDAVLIGAGEEKGVVAGESVIAGNRVGAEGGVDVAEMRLGVGVVDRGGDVKFFGHLGP